MLDAYVKRHEDEITGDMVENWKAYGWKVHHSMEQVKCLRSLRDHQDLNPHYHGDRNISTTSTCTVALL